MAPEIFRRRAGASDRGAEMGKNAVFEHSYFSYFMRTHTRFQVETLIFCKLIYRGKRQRQSVILERQQYQTYYPSPTVLLRIVKNLVVYFCNRGSTN